MDFENVTPFIDIFKNYLFLGDKEQMDQNSELLPLMALEEHTLLGP